MRFKRLTNKGHPLYERAMELYRGSFPPHELRREEFQAEILGDEDYHFTLIREGESFVGLILYWDMGEGLYIEHFCILPEERNHGYGQRALALLGEEGKTLILEIDPPVDEISKRREGFYIRCGFVENPYPHVHPPYHRGNRGHDLVVMSSPRGITGEEYEEFARYLGERVMRGALG